MIPLSLISSDNSQNNQEIGDNHSSQSFSFKKYCSCCRKFPFFITLPLEGLNLPLLPHGIPVSFGSSENVAPKESDIGVWGRFVRGLVHRACTHARVHPHVHGYVHIFRTPTLPPAPGQPLLPCHIPGSLIRKLNN